jgi:hypothetical protein
MIDVNIHSNQILNMSDLFEEMKKEEQEFYAKMEKEENDAIIQLVKCFALRLKLRSEEGITNLSFTVKQIMYAMEQVKDKMIENPHLPEYPVSIVNSNDRIFQLLVQFSRHVVTVST